MLYGLIALLVVAAIVLVLLKVAVGGGILGVLAVLVLIYLVINGPKRV